MPIYEYRCQTCGVFEQIQHIKEKPLRKCPVCKGSVKRIIPDGTSFILKGSGWARDGYTKN